MTHDRSGGITVEESEHHYEGVERAATVGGPDDALGRSTSLRRLALMAKCLLQRTVSLSSPVNTLRQS